MTSYSALGLPSPQSTDHARLWEHIDALADQVQLLLGTLPDVETAFGNGVNTIVSGAGAWAALPSFIPTVTITNPSATLDLLVDLGYGAWMSDTVGTTRISPVASGGLSIAAGVGNGGPIGWGEIPLTSTGNASHYAGCTIVIPAGAAAVNITLQAQRSAATGTQTVNYPTIRATPLRFLAP